MKAITNRQKTIIWTIVKKSGIDEGDFRDWLERNYDTRSTRKLTGAMAADVIKSLKVFTGEEFEHYKYTWGITKRQMWFVLKLVEKLGWQEQKRLHGMIKKMFDPKNRIEQLTKTEGTKLIIALEKMMVEVERGEKTYA